MARILIAASSKSRAIAERMLNGHHLTCAETLAEAADCLRKNSFDLIFCTVMFDDSRMFDLLRLAKSKSAWAQTPFVCARLRPTTLPEPISWEAIELACEQMGASLFLNVANFTDPDRQMRRIVDRLVKTAKG